MSGQRGEFVLVGGPGEVIKHFRRQSPNVPGDCMHVPQGWFVFTVSLCFS